MSEPCRGSASHRWAIHFADPLELPESERVALLGAKGAELRELARAGLPVPPGFTITTQACREYIRLGRQWPDGLEQEVRELWARLGKDACDSSGTGAAVARQPAVAVRSGAAVSLPGAMKTTLDDGSAAIDGANARDTWAALRARISDVFDSWNGEVACAIRRQRGLADDAGTAVTIQRMFPSQVAGVLLTRSLGFPSRAAPPTNASDTGPDENRELPGTARDGNPKLREGTARDGNPKLREGGGAAREEAPMLLIEAVLGPGDRLVSGQITPQRFTVDRETRQVVEQELGQREPLLSQGEIDRLSQLAECIERLRGSPQEIEWGLAGVDVAIFQARAIVPAAHERLDRVRQRVIEGLRAERPGRRNQRPRFWVRHALGESLDFPTPLTWDIWREFMSAAGGFGRLYRELGFLDERSDEPGEFLELIGGRVYADVDRAARWFGGGWPLRYDREQLREAPNRLELGPTLLDDERITSAWWLRFPRQLWRSLRARRRRDATPHLVRTRFEQRFLPEFSRWVAAEQARDLAGEKDAALPAILSVRRCFVMDQGGHECLRPGLFAALAVGSLARELTSILGPDEANLWTMRLTSGLDLPSLDERDALLRKVARGEGQRQEFLDLFGHRGADEYELMSARWREDPRTIDRLLDSSGSASGGRAFPAAERRACDEELERRLEELGAASLASRLRPFVHAARVLIPFRELGRHHWLRGFALLRDVVVEMGRRWGVGANVFFLSWDELLRFPVAPRELPELVGELAARREQWRSFQRLRLPDVIDAARLDELDDVVADTTVAARLPGTRLSAGVARGPALVIGAPDRRRDEHARSAAGSVLVCRSLDPAITPLLWNAAGLVVEQGGMLSHAAVVARQLGIPALACPGVTERIRERQMLRVDADEGALVIEPEIGE